MNFMKSAKLGFNNDQILVIKAPEDSLIAKNLNYYRSEFLKSSAVVEFCTGGFASNLGTSEPFASPLWLKDGTDRQFIVPNITVDKNYPAMLKLKVKEGQSFPDVKGEHVNGLALINESFARMAGWKNPIGEKISTYAGEGTVIGVVQDFHFKSLHNSIEPLAIMGMSKEKPDARYFFLRTSPADLNEVQVLWKKYFPAFDFEYFFLDDFFNEQYKAEENLQVLFLYFTVLTIVVSASGLFGLTVNHVELKTQEIGIRKVLGAGTFSLIQLLSAGFFRLISIGSVVGIATGVFASQQWLSAFAYQTELHALLIGLPAIGILLLSTLIIFYKTYRGAMRNPVDTLRHE
jgi:putative ABC transport system permease protein